MLLRLNRRAFQCAADFAHIAVAAVVEELRVVIAVRPLTLRHLVVPGAAFRYIVEELTRAV